MKQLIILGTKVDFLSKEEVIKNIFSAIKLHKKYFIVTANGEFVLEARKDAEFAGGLKKADVILPDGVSLLQAREFIHSRLSGGNGIILALKIFLKTLRGGYKDQIVAGVEILRHFVNIPKNPKSPRIFLLGGHHGVARLLAEKYHCDFHPGVSDINNITTEQNKEILSIIKKANPDILFVSFGHFAQEKWIAQNLENLSCKVVMGVGSSFDELAGVGQWQRPVPDILKKTGLKWLWRLIKNPGHIKRVWEAVLVFAFKLYLSQVS